MDEDSRGLDRAKGFPARVAAEGADVPVGRDPAIGRDPRCTPAEAGDPVPLELLGEGPQLVEAERLASPGDVVLTHRERSYASEDL